jgi:hypothetical protein
MNNRKVNIQIIIYIFIFVFMGNHISAQDYCLKIDSIRVFYITKNINTVISLDDWEVRNFDTNYVKTLCIRDSISLKKFADLNILEVSEVDTLGGHIDTRIVVDIYLKYNYFLSISLNKHGEYNINGIICYRNLYFIKWLQDNVPDILIEM